jgi:hypothetical protein
MSAIAMTPVTSANVEAIGWRGDVLHVKYKGGRTYMYQGVPESLYKRALASESVGSFIHHNVKAHYEGLRIDHGVAHSG